MFYNSTESYNSTTDYNNSDICHATQKGVATGVDAEYQFTDCFLGPLLSLLIVLSDPTTIYPFKIRKQKSVRAAVSSGATVVVSNDYRDLLASGVLAALYVINEKA